MAKLKFGKNNTVLRNAGSASYEMINSLLTPTIIKTFSNPNSVQDAPPTSFGTDMAVDATHMLISASKAYALEGLDGQVYLMDKTTEEVVHTFSNENLVVDGKTVSMGNNYGVSVDMNATFVCVGADNATADGVTLGAVNVYDRSTGLRLYTLLGTSPGGYFGTSVRIVNGKLYVGNSRDSTLRTQEGSVRVYDLLTGTPITTLSHPNSPNAGGAYMGEQLRVLGDRLFVSARNSTFNSSQGSGEVQVYDTTTDTLITTIYNPNDYSFATQDYFGTQFHVSNKYIVVSATGEDTEIKSSAGRLYVFDADTYTLLHTLYSPNSTWGSWTQYYAIAGDALLSVRGTSSLTSSMLKHDLITGLEDGQVALPFSANWVMNAYATYNNELFICDYENSLPYTDPLSSDRGVVHEYDILTLTSSRTITFPGEHAYNDADAFGRYFAYDAATDRIAIQANEPGTDGQTSSGAVTLYNYTTNELLQTFINPNTYSTSQADYFGQGIAIYGNNVIIGAYGEGHSSYPTHGDIGVVYVYDATTGGTIRTLINPTSNKISGYFGSMIKVHNDKLYIAGYRAYSSSSAEAGSIFVYDLLNNFNYLYQIQNPNNYSTPRNDYFGQDFDVSDSYILVGASGEDALEGTSTGAAYLFDLNNTEIRRFINPGLDGNPAGEQFGHKVRLSGEYAYILAYGKRVIYKYSIATGNIERTFGDGVRYITCFDVINDRIAFLTEYQQVSVIDTNTGEVIHDIIDPDMSNSSPVNLEFIDDTTILFGDTYQWDDLGAQSGKVFVYELPS